MSHLRFHLCRNLQACVISRICPGMIMADASFYISCVMALALFDIMPTKESPTSLTHGEGGVLDGQSIWSVRSVSHLLSLSNPCIVVIRNNSCAASHLGLQKLRHSSRPLIMNCCESRCQAIPSRISHLVQFRFTADFWIYCSSFFNILSAL